MERQNYRPRKSVWIALLCAALAALTVPTEAGVKHIVINKTKSYPPAY